MGDLIRFWDYKRETLPATPFGPKIDLRDRPSARIYVMPSTHVIGRIYPKAASPSAAQQCAPRLQSAKLLPPVFLNFEDKKS